MKDARQTQCLNDGVISLEGRIMHILTDVGLLCVPITIVLRFQIPGRRNYCKGYRWKRDCIVCLEMRAGELISVSSQGAN
jgi:hypothetical protein